MDEVFAASSGDPGVDVRGREQGGRDIYSSSPAGLETLSLVGDPPGPLVAPRSGHRRTGSR